jgi:hypothetical protein
MGTSGTVAIEAKRAAHSAWVEWLGRLGLLAKGASYAIVAVLAIKVALAHDGRTEDRPGALRALADEPLGHVLLIGLAAGFAAYAVWRFVQAFLDRDEEGNDITGIGKRAGFLARGLVYAGLCLSTLSLLLGDGDGGAGNKEDRATAGVLEAPAGRWFVIAAGAAVICVGLYNGYRALTRKFEERLRLGELGPGTRRFVVTVGVLGHLARFAVFSIIGWFLIKAAVEFEPKQAIGLDGALAQLAQQAYGKWLLFTVAAGILAYGIYATVEARYRRI